MASDKPGLTYRDAGVDIDAGDALVERIKGHVRRTMRPEVMTDLGGFAGLCALPTRYREPLLVSCTDGVGTKLKLAFLTGRHNTVGVDLVAMNVNDLVVCGAEPLFFLDYFASGKLEVGVAEQVIAGIADGCQAAGCALIGGETAELPGFYADGEYDLAGFSVGVVEKSRRVDGRAIAAGDKLLGLASSGFHSNGYSLVRRVFLEHMRLELGDTPPGLPSRWRMPCFDRRASTHVLLPVSMRPGCCAGPPTSPAAGSSTIRPGCSQPMRASASVSISAAGRCRRYSGSWRGEAMSPTRRCGVPSTWESECSSVFRPTAPLKRSRCSNGPANGCSR